jgi:hypothetical protein
MRALFEVKFSRLCQFSDANLTIVSNVFFRGQALRKVEEYRRHADECRKLAAASTHDESRQQLLQMAETWEGLARDREEQIARQERISRLESDGNDNGHVQQQPPATK